MNISELTDVLSEGSSAALVMVGVLRAMIPGRAFWRRRILLRLRSNGDEVPAEIFLIQLGRIDGSKFPVARGVASVPRSWIGCFVLARCESGEIVAGGFVECTADSTDAFVNLKPYGQYKQ